MAWWAHVGGFGAGMLLHWIFVDRRRPVQRWTGRGYTD